MVAINTVDMAGDTLYVTDVFTNATKAGSLGTAAMIPRYENLTDNQNQVDRKSVV